MKAIKYYYLPDEDESKKERDKRYLAEIEELKEYKEIAAMTPDEFRYWLSIYEEE